MDALRGNHASTTSAVESFGSRRRYPVPNSELGSTPGARFPMVDSATSVTFGLYFDPSSVASRVLPQLWFRFASLSVMAVHLLSLKIDV